MNVKSVLKRVGPKPYLNLLLGLRERKWAMHNLLSFLCTSANDYRTYAAGKDLGE